MMSQEIRLLPFEPDYRIFIAEIAAADVSHRLELWNPRVHDNGFSTLAYVTMAVDSISPLPSLDLVILSQGSEGPDGLPIAGSAVQPASRRKFEAFETIVLGLDGDELAESGVLGADCLDALDRGGAEPWVTVPIRVDDVETAFVVYRWRGGWIAVTALRDVTIAVLARGVNLDSVSLRSMSSDQVARLVAPS